MLVREMRAAARRRATHIARMLAALGAIGFGIYALYFGMFQYLPPATAGRSFFECLILAGYAFAVFYGTLSTCDCISQEKRDGTLGLLFLTRLNSLDVIWGKTLPRLSHSIYCLLAAMPSLAFVFILGGVTLLEFFTAVASVANALFFFTALGLLVSVFSQNEKRVFSMALSLALALGVAAPACVIMGQSFGASSISPSALISMGPSIILFASRLNAQPASPTGIPVQSLAFWANHALAWLMLLLAGIRLARSVRETGNGENRLHQLFFRPISITQRRRARTDLESDSWWEVNPFFETVIRFDLRQSSPTARFCILFLAFLVLLFAYPQGWLFPTGWISSDAMPSAWFSPPVFPAAVLLTHLLLKFAVAAEACHSLSTERRSGGLELLLVTPPGESEIVRGHLLAIKRRYVTPTLLVLGFQGLLVVTGLPQLKPMSQLLLIALFCALSLWLIMDLYALSWMGLWCGLRMANTSKAIVQSVLGVMVLPSAVMALYQTAVWVICDVAGWNEENRACLLFASPAVFLAGWVGVLAWPIYCLREKFRDTVSTPIKLKR